MPAMPPPADCHEPSPLKKFPEPGVPDPIRAGARVPLEILEASVVSVVADAAKPEILDVAIAALASISESVIDKLSLL